MARRRNSGEEWSTPNQGFVDLHGERLLPVHFSRVPGADDGAWILPDGRFLKAGVPVYLTQSAALAARKPVKKKLRRAHNPTTRRVKARSASDAILRISARHPGHGGVLDFSRHGDEFAVTTVNPRKTHRMPVSLAASRLAHHRWRTNGATLDEPGYPFARKEAQYREMTDTSLHYNLHDAVKARDNAAAMARAGHGINASAAENWYADDVHTIGAEIRRRKPKSNRGHARNPRKIHDVVLHRQGTEFSPSSRVFPPEPPAGTHTYISRQWDGTLDKHGFKNIKYQVMHRGSPYTALTANYDSAHATCSMYGPVWVFDRLTGTWVAPGATFPPVPRTNGRRR